MNGENGILLNEYLKGPFYPGDPFLWTFNPRTDWKTGRLLEGEVEIETVRFEDAQGLVTKVQQHAQRTCGNRVKGLAHFVRSGPRKPGRKEIPTEYQRCLT